MKTTGIIIFMFSIFFMMGIIGYAIPDNGLKIGNITVEFPTIDEIVRPEQPEFDNTRAFVDAENMRQFIAASKLSEKMQRQREVLKHKYAIDYPKDSIEWIFAVFEALEKAEYKKVRILHYGDSQIEVDRITSELRDRMQNLFGGYGVGLVPAIQTVPTTAIGQSCDKELTRYLVFGPQDMRMPEDMNQNYGIMGQAALVNGSATFSFRALNMKQTKNRTKKAGNITLLTDMIDEDLTVTVSYDNATGQQVVNAGTKRITFQLPDSTSNLSVTITGNCLLHGFLLDGNGPGVQYDNAAMRGCSGTIFTSISAVSMQSYLSHYSVPLIIMQYGGNVVPYIKTDKQIENYCNGLKRQIDYIKRISPESHILFIGPSDMSTNIGGKMVSYPKLKELVNALKTMCLDNNVAYWNMYKAMGGENSMAKWVSANPPLAGADYVHFTLAGANQTADMLFDAIETAYGYYKWKQTTDN